MFKDLWLDKTYNDFRNNPPKSERHMLGDCYWKGYNGEAPGYIAKGTQAYAAYAAGRDNAKESTR